MRVSVILLAHALPRVALAASCFTSCFGGGAARPADETVPVSEPQPLSGNPGWSVAAYGGLGAIMMNTAGGQHLITPELSLSSAVRISDLTTMRTTYDFAWRRDGAPSSDVWIDNQYHVISPRFDLTYGTDKTQFVIGAGPALVFTTTRVHGPGRNVHANDWAPGFVYGLGLRWKFGRMPFALDFGGQQRELRHDFRATFSMGFALLGSVKEERDDTTRGRRIDR